MAKCTGHGGPLHAIIVLDQFWNVIGPLLKPFSSSNQPIRIVPELNPKNMLAHI